MSTGDTPVQVSTEQRASLIVYPSDIAVKAMGLAEPAVPDPVQGPAADVPSGAESEPPVFRALVESLVLPLIEPDTPSSIDERVSSGGKYLSVSVHFTVTSRGQLEAIYSALHAEPRVLFTL